MSDVSDLIYLLDEEKDADDRRYQGFDDSDQIGFSWDGFTFWSCSGAHSQIRQEIYGHLVVH